MATNLYRTRVVFTGLAGSPYLATHYFDAETGTVQDCIDATDQFWNDARGVISTALGWTVQAEVATIDTTTDQAVAFGSGTAATNSGSSSAEVMPFASQLLVQWFTGVTVAGRRVRGHTFIPGVTDTSNDSGHVLDASQSTLQTAADNLIGNDSTVLEIYSRKNGVGESVASAAVPNDWAVLRSRRD